MTEASLSSPQTPLAATLIGCLAILLWSALALLTAASGSAPPFELAALTFAVGGGFGLAYAAARGRLRALIQPWPVWLVGVGGCSAITRFTMPRCDAPRPPRRA